MKGNLIMKIILASTSPRRKEILADNHIEFEVIPSAIKEKIIANLSPLENVKRLARLKCLDVYERYKDEVVLAADTIVCYNGTIFGKPKDEKDAFNMLNTLQGKTHEVITAVCVASRKGISVEAMVSKVAFYHMIKEEIFDYIATKEPMDKAGSYAIQGLGKKYIKYYEGDFDNIVGLPMKIVNKLLEEHKKNE